MIQLFEANCLIYYLHLYRTKTEACFITSDLDKIADCITFINDGKIIFSCTKDEIFENYGLVKGPKEVLHSDIQQLLISVKENQFGFEALTEDKQKIKRMLGDKIIVDKPSLEDVIVHFQRGM